MSCANWWENDEQVARVAQECAEAMNHETFRDKAALAALPGCLRRYGTDDAAIHAYRVADAMVKARRPKEAPAPSDGPYR